MTVSRASHPKVGVSRSARLWHVVAVFCALGLTLPNAWRALHVALVPHVACPYDGALIHEDELAELKGSVTRSGELESAYIPEHHHGCDALNWHHQPSAPPTVGSATLSLTLTARAPVAAPLRYRAWSRPVLSYAPRLPPPAERTA